MIGAALATASPCIGLCRLDLGVKICIGCGRTGDEIAGWRRADDEQRRAVIGELASRLSALDRVGKRFADTPQEVRAIVMEALLRPGAAVVAGCQGAVAEFMAPAGETPRVRSEGTTLEAVVTGGALRLELASDLAIFGANGSDRSAPLLLAAPFAGRALLVANGLTRLGADLHAIRNGDTNGFWGAVGQRQRLVRGAEPANRDGAVLFDLGLGRADMRFLVRTADPALVARLVALEGMPLSTVLGEAGPLLVEVSPDRVVETPLCRIEVSTPIPPPGGQSPVAPHTHLLPGPLALGRLLPTGIGCPVGYTPAALVYAGESV